MRDKVLEILADVCEDDDIRNNVDIELLDSGLLDSLGYAELLARIEDEIGVVISPSEVSRQDMNTPSKIIVEIEKRLSHE